MEKGNKYDKIFEKMTPSIAKQMDMSPKKKGTTKKTVKKQTKKK